MDISEIYNQRLEKLARLRAEKIAPYGEKFSATSTIYKLKNSFKEGEKVIICGRVMALRSHGKTSFIDLRGEKDKIQVYVRKDNLSDSAVIFENLDIGDIVGIEGETFLTKTKEPTVKADRLTLLSKSLKPLPEKWHGLKDVEIRYRQRYLDLISNPQIKEVFLIRNRIITAVRSFLDSRNFLEVETPMLQFIPGGAAGKPFKTYHEEFKADMYLRIAPELYLKKLLVAGFDNVYEINRSFRNEGVSTRHNPEFTMLEVYSAYSDCKGMMDLVAQIIRHIAKEVLGRDKINYQGKMIDLALPWKEKSFAQAVKDRFGIAPGDSAGEMVEKLRKSGRKVEAGLSRSQIVRIVEDLLSEDDVSSPVFVTDYFSLLCPLAKNKTDNPEISERFELFIAGMEVANAYSELNDPIEQRKRFEEDLKDGAQEKIDDDFINALEYGMPPAGGLGIGIDRLVMLFADQPSIRDVILFPHLRPEKD
ncbi:MAG: lysine--tRNA ligase [Candidatus Omnitrophica bacterium CG11_big_fil_rev_8_21_14_0_20_42_13]|uniref:Lysine--tRNA ligase n=1 Tax=Candidatus Ghiorseimicrobium undicola TaxID=1974746 RepID=A0A2H0LW04_9BACT|nr:MAG: lysine--tRNA ligase [Candidatus Omnitrophica bacterium CG11_big_fil_rev_8_21_14_0_20_42_13]